MMGMSSYIMDLQEQFEEKVADIVKESEHVAEMIEKVGDHVSPREMNAVKQILKEMLPELPNEKVETLILTQTGH